MPFLYTALGGPILYSGLFAPVVVVAGLLAQLLGARLIGVARRSRGYLALSTMVVAAVLAGVAGLTGDTVAVWLPVVFVAASVVMGMSNSFGLLTFQDMIGRVLLERSRINLLFAIGVASGAGVIVTTLVSQFVNGFAASEATPRDHALLVWFGAGMMLLSAVVALAVRESPRVLPPVDAREEGGKSYIGSLYDSIRFVSRLAWFRRFVVARMLFLSVEMVMPFFAVHAATFHARTAPSLSLFVIAFSFGMIGGGLVWPYVSRKSIQLVLSISPMVAGLAALLAFVSHIIVSLQSPFTHAAMIFLLAFATQGTLDGSTAYVVGSSTDEERPYCIAGLEPGGEHRRRRGGLCRRPHRLSPWCDRSHRGHGRVERSGCRLRPDIAERPCVDLTGRRCEGGRPLPLSASWSDSDVCYPCGTRPSKCRNHKDPSKYMILLELLNLTFEQEHGSSGDSNVNFAPLAGQPAKSPGDQQSDGEHDERDAGHHADRRRRLLAGRAALRHGHSAHLHAGHGSRAWRAWSRAGRR